MTHICHYDDSLEDKNFKRNKKGYPAQEELESTAKNLATIESTFEKMIRLGFYYELSVGNEWCFKHQLPGQEVIIVSNKDKEKAASDFFIEFLKSLHYCLRWLWENDRVKELTKTIKKYGDKGDENIDCTISIVISNMDTPFD